MIVQISHAYIQKWCDFSSFSLGIKKNKILTQKVLWEVSNMSWAPNSQSNSKPKGYSVTFVPVWALYSMKYPLCNGTHLGLSVCNSQSRDMFWKCIFDFGSSKKSWEEVKTERLFETLQKACVLPGTINYQLSCQSLQKWIKKPQKAVT